VVRLAVRQAGGRGDSDLVDELVGSGMVGLWQAHQRYDESQGGFWKFAYLRVEGAMRDVQRLSDTLSREVRGKVKRGEVSPSLMLAFPVELDEAADVPSDHDPEEISSSSEEVRCILGRLCGRELEVLLRTLVAGESLEEVSIDLGVTPSRVCQVKHKLLRRLKRQMVYCEVCRTKRLDGPPWCSRCGNRLRHLLPGEVLGDPSEHPSAAASGRWSKGVVAEVAPEPPPPPPPPPLPKTRGKRGRPLALYDLRGEKLTVLECAERAGVTARAIQSRLHRGWSVEEAVETRGRAKSGRSPALHDLRGEKLTVLECAERAGVTVNTIRSRLIRGWSVEEAVGTKVRPRGR
jgi:RNA polymerase sigma factor (sigma-70 family)